MPAIHTDRHDTLLMSSLAWLLPRPLVLDDWLVIHRPRDLERAHHSSAILQVGRVGQRNALPTAAEHLRFRESFRLFPTVSAPRALLAADASRRAHYQLVQPRRTLKSPLKRLAVGMVQRLPGAFHLLSAPVDVATTAPSEILEALRHQVPDGTIGIFLGHRAHHARPSIQVLDDDGSPIAITKFVQDDEGRRRLAHEATILAHLRTMSVLANSIPMPLAHIRGHVGSALITDAFVGEPAPLELSSTILAWLERCRIGSFIKVAEADPIQTLVRSMQEHDDPDPILAAAVRHAVAAIGGVEAPLSVVHGDFVPWNILIVAGAPKVFDWEYACLNGILGWDLAFFRLQTGLTIERWSSDQIVDAMATLANDPPVPYAAEVWRSVLLLVLAEILRRDIGANSRDRIALIRRSMAHLLSSGWLPVSIPFPVR